MRVAERWESGKNLLDEEAFDAALLALNLPESVRTALVVLLAKRDVWVVIFRDALIEPLASSEGPLARKEVVTAKDRIRDERARPVALGDDLSETNGFRFRDAPARTQEGFAIELSPPDGLGDPFIENSESTNTDLVPHMTDL